MDGPVQGIKVTEVCETAKTQFEELLNGVNGPKDLVIQKELMSLLEHVTPMKVLKRLASELRRLLKYRPTMYLTENHNFPFFVS